MITNWTFTDVPPRIDLSEPLMPDRDESDMAIYGVDPAWLHEVLAAWYTLQGGNAGGKSEMPEGPSAAFTNRIRALAYNIKTASGSRPFYSSAPTGTYVTPPTPVAFDEIPGDVAAGDEVRREDVSAMFEWIEDAACFRAAVGGGIHVLSYSSQTYEEGGRSSGEIAPAATPVLRKWYWFYFETNGHLWSENGGAWRLDIANDFDVSFTIFNARADWIESASVYVPVSIEDQSGARGEAYAPAGATATIEQSGDNVLITCCVDSSACAAAAMSALGVSEKQYKTDMETEWQGTTYITQGEGHMTATAGTAIAYVTLAEDYRHPSRAI